MGSSNRLGQGLHDFVALLERMFAGREGVTVQSPLRLRDKDTGHLREHDVVITRQSHHGPSLTAIECKDQGRKVGVPQIEAFAKKCEKTGIHRGIVVAANGFTNTARKKAKALNLTCMDLAEAQSFQWIGSSSFIGCLSNFTSITCRATLRRDKRAFVRPLSVHAPDGTLFHGGHAQALIMDILPPETRYPKASETFTGQILVPVKGFFALDARGERFDLQEIEFHYTLEVEVKESPITLHNYAGEDIALEIAAGQINFAAGQSSMTLVKSGDGLKGYILSRGGGDEHRIKIGELPERRLPAYPLP